MMKFKKVFNLKVIIFAISTSFLFTVSTYSFQLKDALRVPVGEKSTYQRMISSMHGKNQATGDELKRLGLFVTLGAILTFSVGDTNSYKFKDLAQQGNENVVDAVQGNSAAKGALFINPAKFKNFAQQGNDTVYALLPLAAQGDSAAFNALKDLAKQGNENAVYVLLPLVEQGSSAAFNALKDVFNNARGLKNYTYYQIANTLLKVILYEDINIPEEFKSERLEVFKDDFKKVLSHMKFESGVDNPEVMKIVYKSINLLGTELVSNTSSMIEQKFYRPPQRILFYLCIPEVVAPLVEAYKEINMVNADLSFSYFVGAAFAEGYTYYAEDVITYNKGTSFSNTAPLGLDRFGKVEESLKKTGFLPRNYEGFVRSGGTYVSEFGDSYPSGTFKNPKAALVAHGALLLEDRAIFLKDVQSLGYDINMLTEEEIGVGTYLYYCSGNPIQYVKQYGPDLIGKIKNGKHGQPLFNAQWPQATSVLLDKVYGNLLRIKLSAMQGSNEHPFIFSRDIETSTSL